MNVKDKIKRLREVVVSEMQPDNADVLWIKKDTDSTYTLFINDGLEWITPQVSESKGTQLSDAQIEAIRKAENIRVDGSGILFLSDDGTYKDLSSFLSGYAKLSDIPYSTSQLSNDSGFVAESELLEKHYTKEEIDAKIEAVDNFDSTKYYTKEDTESLLDSKADKSSLDDYARKADIPSVPSKISELENDSKFIKESQVDRVLMLSSGNPIANDVVKTEFNKYTSLINKRVPLLDDIILTRFNEAYNKDTGSDLATYYDTYFKNINDYSSCGSAGYNSSKNENNFFINTLIVSDISESNGGDGNVRYMLFTDEFGETGKISSTVRIITIDKTAKTLTSKNTYDLMVSSGGSGTSDYGELSNKPSINNVTLASGNNTLDALGIQPKGEYATSSALSALNEAKIDKTIANSNFDSINSDITSLKSKTSSMDKSLTIVNDQVTKLTNDKQDSLVSGENIKTINGNSLLGDGDISISAGTNVTVDTALSSTSTNPVQNKVVNTALSNKVDKVSGKSLSTNDFTNEYKAKVDSALQSYTETDPTVPAWAKAATKPTYTAKEVGALPDTTEIPTKTSQLTNDSGFLTKHQSLDGYSKKVSFNHLTITGDESVSITPDVMSIIDASGYTSGTISISLITAGYTVTYLHEYMIQIIIGTTPPTVSWPSYLLWPDGKAVSLSTGYVFEFHITRTTAGFLVVWNKFKSAV